MKTKGLAILTAWLFILLSAGISSAAYVSSLEQISPDAVNYTFRTDFHHFWNVDNMYMEPATGEAEGSLQFAGYGDEDDFSDFVSGNIALIERGHFSFAYKMNNAFNAGAIGVIIFYNEGGSRELWEHALSEETYIPALITTRALGLDLLSLLDSGHDVVMKMSVQAASAVPEPATLLLLGAGLLAVAGSSRKNGSS